MRRLIHIAFTFIFGLAAARAVLAQDANQIIEQYLKAAGGNKSISQIQTVSIDGAFNSGAEAKPGTFTFRARQPNRFYTEIQSEGKALIESYNGKSSWRQAENGEIGTLLGLQALELQAAAEYYNARLQALPKRKIGVVFKGHAQVRGRDALQVELTYRTGVKWEVYFDPQTHLIEEEQATIVGISRDIYYDDYRDVGGVKLPYKLELHRGNDTYAVNVTRAAVNETVDERVFDFPKKSQVQLPDLKKLFEEIDANQKLIDKIRENYAGTNVVEQTEFDKTGKVTKKEVREYTFFYLDGEGVSTLVKKDGKPLSDDEQKRENEKTQKRIAEIQKNRKKEEAKEAKANEDPDIDMFLRISQFVNPRRERFRGQDVLVFDFEPNPKYKPKNMDERVVKELAGVVWVDEKAHDVARLEAYFVGDVKIFGGLLANLQKGTSFVFEQGYLNNEVWLPTYVEAHVGLRMLLLKRFKVNVVNRFSDYKRFSVETLSTINKPKKPVENPSKP